MYNGQITVIPRKIICLPESELYLITSPLAENIDADHPVLRDNFVS